MTTPTPTKYNAQRSMPAAGPQPAGHQGQDPQTDYEPPLEVQLEMNARFIRNVEGNLRHFAALLRGYQQQRTILMARDVRTQAQRVRSGYGLARDAVREAAAAEKDALIGRLLA
jgi:hypothetical protein